MEREVYKTTSRRGTKAEALVIRCASYEIAAPVQEFVLNKLKLGERDILAFPGGVQMLAQKELFPRYQTLMYRMAEYLVTKHGLKQAVLIAHEGCSWYREPAYGGFPNDTRKAVQAQLADLKFVASLFRRELNLPTQTYLARPIGNGLTFFEID